MTHKSWMKFQLYCPQISFIGLQACPIILLFLSMAAFVGVAWLHSYDRDCVVCKAHIFSFFMYEIFIFIYKLIFIGVNYFMMLSVSAVQQSKSVLCIHICPLF